MDLNKASQLLIKNKTIFYFIHKDLRKTSNGENVNLFEIVKDARRKLEYIEVGIGKIIASEVEINLDSYHDELGMSGKLYLDTEVEIANTYTNELLDFIIENPKDLYREIKEFLFIYGRKDASSPNHYNSADANWLFGVAIDFLKKGRIDFSWFGSSFMHGGYKQDKIAEASHNSIIDSLSTLRDINKKWGIKLF